MKILIVDDEKLVLWSLKQSFLKHHIDIHTETCAEDAMAELQRSKFDWLITDFRLPGQDGLYLADQARKHNPKIKVIIISAYCSSTLINRLKEKNIHTFFSKPFNIENIISFIEHPNQDVLEDKFFFKPGIV